jgi:DNA mismatch repair protein MSH4
VPELQQVMIKVCKAAVFCARWILRGNVVLRTVRSCSVALAPFLLLDLFSESNISTFMLEMKETAFICNNASSGSLVLLDELGRATSNEDGVAIAWAVAENLLSKRSLTFFVTNYPQMCEMSHVYPNVQNQHMKATVSKEGDGSILYSHKVGNGPCRVTSDYGVEMAKSCGWPADIVAEVRF